jgi:hypothetical protein
MKKKPRREIQYYRIVVTYDDGTTSAHKIFPDKAQADAYAARVGASPLVKKSEVVPFVRNQAAWRMRSGKK